MTQKWHHIVLSLYKAVRGKFHCWEISIQKGLPLWLSSKKSACNAKAPGDTTSIPGVGKTPGGRHGNSLGYSCLENPMDMGARRATIHGVTRVGHDWASKQQQQHPSHIAHQNSVPLLTVLTDYLFNWDTQLLPSVITNLCGFPRTYRLQSFSILVTGYLCFSFLYEVNSKCQVHQIYQINIILKK